MTNISEVWRWRYLEGCFEIVADQSAQLVMDMDDDDFFGGPTQGGAQDPLADTEYARIEQRYSDVSCPQADHGLTTQAGYREGITDGKLATLQEGFDQSFAACAPLSRRMGKLRGAANALLSLATAGSGSSSADPALVAELRELISKLSSVKRDDVLPVDHERIEHEKEHAQDENGFELAQTEQRDLESLEDMMGSLGAKPDQPGVRGEQLLNTLEGELAALQSKLGL